MGEGFGPVFPRVGGGVDGDVVLAFDFDAPVVGIKRGLVVGPVVAVEFSEFFQEMGVGLNSVVPIVVTELMTEVSDEGPHFFVQIGAGDLSGDRIGLPEVDGDDAVEMAGGGRLVPGAGHEAKAHVVHGNPQAKTAEEQSSLALFHLSPLFQVALNRQVGNQNVAGTGPTKVTFTVFLPIAHVVLAPIEAALPLSQFYKVQESGRKLKEAAASETA